MLSCPVLPYYSLESNVLWNENKFIVKIWYRIDHNAPLRTAHDLSRVWIQKNNYCIGQIRLRAVQKIEGDLTGCLI